MARTCIILVFVLLVAFSASFTCLQAAREHPEDHVDEKVEEGEEVVMPENLCGYKSKTFSGQCLSRSSCSYQCQVVEHAAAGACHFHHVQRHCYCYRYC